MRIGYTRYNLPVQLSVQHCSDGSALMVIRLLRALVEAGHDVTVYGEIHRKHQPLLKNGEPWQRGLKYEPGGFPDDDTELMLVENGPTNITFQNSHWKIPHIARTHDILRRYKGVVFYQQSDVALPFVFNPELFGYGFMTKWIQHGTAAELFRDKHWVVLTTSRDYPEYNSFREMHNARRSSYKELDVAVEHMNWALLSIEDNIQEFNPDPKHFLCYTGSNRNGRKVKFREFYEDVGVQTSLFGANWGELNSSIDYHGIVDMATIPQVLNDSRVQIMIGDVLFEKLKVLTNRFYEGISCRTILMFDKDFSPADIYPETKDFVIGNKDEARAKLKQLSEMDEEGLKKICDQQLKWVTDHSDQDVVDNLFKLYEKHKAVYEEKSFKDKHLEPRKVWNKFAKHERDKATDDQDKYLLRFYDMLDTFCDLNFDEDGYLKHEPREVEQLPGGYPQICFKCGGNIIPLRKAVAKIRCNLCSGLEKAINADVDTNRQKYLRDGRLRQTETGELFWDSSVDKDLPPQTGDSLMDMFGG